MSACLLIEANSILQLKSLFIRWNATYSHICPVLFPTLQVFAIKDDALFFCHVFSVHPNGVRVSTQAVALICAQQKLQSCISRGYITLLYAQSLSAASLLPFFFCPICRMLEDTHGILFCNKEFQTFRDSSRHNWRL